MKKRGFILTLSVALFFGACSSNNGNPDQQNKQESSVPASEMNPADDTLPATGTPAPSAEGK